MGVCFCSHIFLQRDTHKIQRILWLCIFIIIIWTSWRDPGYPTKLNIILNYLQSQCQRNDGITYFFWDRILSINILQKYTQKSKGQLTVKCNFFINFEIIHMQQLSFHQLPLCSHCIIVQCKITSFCLFRDKCVPL